MNGSIDDKSFTNEFRQLMMVQHENIIRLIGYCYEIRHKHTDYGGQLVFSQVIDRALCFECMKGGSLANHISDESCIHDWATTFNIITGTCEGLHYHLDLKPDNILLYKNMVPKITDLGLSRLFGESKTHKTSSSREGTFGFMALEYIHECATSPKNDWLDDRATSIIVSRGPALLGKSSSTDLPHNAISQVQEYSERRMEYTGDEIDLLGVKICIELAISCVKKERKDRPCTKEIIDELHNLDAQMEVMSNKDTQSLTAFTGQGNSGCRDIELDPSLELRFPFKRKKNIPDCLQLAN